MKLTNGIIIMLLMLTVISCGPKPCPPCPGTDNDSCFCDPNAYSCCPDTISPACDTAYHKACEGSPGNHGEADIFIDTFLVTRAGGEWHTDIIIKNRGDDNASCAKLDVLLPVVAYFIGVEFHDGYSGDWEFYRGYLRINIGDLNTPPNPVPGIRHVTIKTSINCMDSIPSGIGAFVYSRVPDPCLENNYAFAYYNNYSLSRCTPTKIIVNP
jgi:hypothetical protein